MDEETNITQPKLPLTSKEKVEPWFQLVEKYQTKYLNAQTELKYKDAQISQQTEALRQWNDRWNDLLNEKRKAEVKQADIIRDLSERLISKNIENDQQAEALKQWNGRWNDLLNEKQQAEAKQADIIRDLSEKLNSKSIEIAQQSEALNQWSAGYNVLLNEKQQAEAKQADIIRDLYEKLNLKSIEIAQQTEAINQLSAGYNLLMNEKQQADVQQANTIRDLADKLRSKDIQISEQFTKMNLLNDKHETAEQGDPPTLSAQIPSTDEVENVFLEISNDQANDTNVAKRYTCPDCQIYSNDVKAKVNAHRKKGCNASKHLTVKDHQCPVCGEVNDYGGMRMHLNQFIAKNGIRIKSSGTLHRNKNLEYHINLKDNLIKAFSEAKQNQIQYTPLYPINNPLSSEL